MTGVYVIFDGIGYQIDAMLARSKSIQGGLARVYSLYQKFQTERFQSENASEGNAWLSLTPEYAKRKETKFKSYPGSGTKMMIATGTLAGAVIGPGAPFDGVDRHRALFKSTGMEISVVETGINAAGKAFTYASYANALRPVMEFSQDHIDQMKQELVKFIVGKE